MSTYDAVRNRKRGEEAKKRVLERTYSPKEQPQEEESSYAAVRNRKTDTPIESEPKTERVSESITKKLLNDTLNGVRNPDIQPVKTPSAAPPSVAPKPTLQPKLSPFEGKLPASSLLQGNAPKPIQDALKGKLPAADLVQQTGGGPANASKIPLITEYNIREKRLDDTNIPEILKLPARGMNKLAFDTPLGLAVSNSFAGNSGVTQRDSTGNKTVDKITDIINNMVTPILTPTGAPLGEGPIRSTYNATNNILAKYGPKIVDDVANALVIKGLIPKGSKAVAEKVARNMVTETIAGAPQGVLLGLQQGQDSNEEIINNAKLGAVTGGFFAGAGTWASESIPAIASLMKKSGIPESEVNEILALPEARARTVRKTQAGQPNVLNPNADPVKNPYTFQLDEAAPSTLRKKANAAEGRTEVKAIDQEIHNLQTKYHVRVIDEYKTLKEYRDKAKPGTIKQGNMTFDDAGEMTAKFGSSSSNPAWYQQAMKENNYKRLTNKQLHDLAKKNVDEGFDTEVGRVPSWKEENGFDETLSSLQQAREMMVKGVNEMDPALNVTDAPIIDKVLKDTRKQATKPAPKLTPKPVQKPAAPETSIPSKPALDETGDVVQQLVKKIEDRGGSVAPDELKGLQGQVDSAIKRGTTGKEFEKMMDNVVEDYVPAAKKQVVEKEVAATVEKEAHIPAEKQKQDAFTDLFGEQGLGIVSSANAKGARMSTADQIVSKRIKVDKEGVQEAAKAQLRAIHQNHVDKLDPIKNISQEAYNTAMDASRANNMANVIINDAFVNMEGQVVGESLKTILGKVARGQDKNFLDYLNLKRATTRMANNQQVFADELKMTLPKVKDRLEVLEKRYPGFEAIAKDYYNFWDNILQLAVDEGIITQASKKAMQDAEPFYVPQYRQFKKSEKPGRSLGTQTAKPAFSGQKAPIKEVNPNGSGRDLVDARKTTIESVGAWTNTIMRNRAMQEAIKAVKANPEKYKGILEIVEPPKSKTDLHELLAQDDLIESLNGDFIDLFKTSKVDGENIVRGMVKGEPVYLKVHDPEIVKALATMGPETSSLLLDGMAAFSNATKRGATGLLAPVFAIKGATMDLAQSAIQAKNPVKQATYSVYAIMSGMGDALKIPGLRNWAREYERAGGGYSYALKGERKLNKNVSDITKHSLLSPKNALKVTRKVVGSPFAFLEEVGNVFENAPRIAASKIERQRLGNEVSPKTVRSAMNAGREATVNYSRSGLLSREMESLAPYSNAAVQGTRRVLVALKNNPVRTSAAIGVIAVAPKLYEYSQFHDDEDYQQIPARERMRNIIVKKNKDGSFAKIPMDPSYASFGEMTIQIMRYAKDNDPNAFKGSMDALANAWTPPLLTGLLQGVTKDSGPKGSLSGVANATIFGPASAILSNKSFTGAPIVSGSLAGRSSKYQYDEKTSKLAKKVGEVTGASPVEIDYIIKAYGGDLARLVLPLTSDLGQGNTRNTLLRNFIVDPTFTNTLSEDFYAAKDKLNQAYKDTTDLDKPLPAWYDDEIRKAINSNAKGSVNKQLSDLRAYKKTITSDKTLTAKERTTKIREIQEEINAIYVKVNAVLSEQGVIK